MKPSRLITKYKANTMSTFMQFNQQEAEKSGGSDSLQEGGAYICKIESAIYTCSSNKGTHGIEFSVVTKDGAKARYMTAYYAKADNTPISGGQSLLNALMGFTGAQSLTFVERKEGNELVSCVPEFEGKVVGLFLEKILYTKSSGGDGYKFNIRCPFDPKTMQTFKEKSKSTEAVTIKRMTESYSDKDERNSGGNKSQESYENQSQQTQGSTGYDNFDDIPGFDD